MEKILVFDSYEQAYGNFISVHYEKNTWAMKQMLEEYFSRKEDIGKGLELTRIVELEVTGGRYFYTQIQDGLNPSPKSDNNIAYRTIPKLVKGVHELLEEQKSMYFNVNVDTQFITIDEENNLFSVEHKLMLEECLADQKSTGLWKCLPFFERILFKWIVKEILNNQDIVRGLNEKEREEFERLYFRK